MEEETREERLEVTDPSRPQSGFEEEDCFFFLTIYKLIEI